MADIPALVQQLLDQNAYQHPELINLVPYITEGEASSIANDVLDSCQEDEDSRSEWMKMHTEWLNLYFQRDDPVNPPWDGSSNESIPQLAEACNQFHSRAYKQMFPSRNIIQAVPVGNPDPSSKERAERVKKHMSWQLMARDKDYVENKDSLLLSLPLHGSFFTKTYYDPVKKKNVVKNVRAVDLIIPYGTGPRSLEDIDRRTEVIWLPENRTKILAAKGYLTQPAVPVSFVQANEMDQAHDKAMGLQDTPFGKSKHCKILEQHTVIDLDQDGIGEPYIATVDTESRKLLRLSIRWDTDEAGFPTDDMAPVEYYTHYQFLKNPDGFYGLGYGHLIGKLNTAINKLTRQTVDAGTLANAGNSSGFVSSALNIKGGELKMALGKFQKISNSMEDINKGLFQFKFPGPSPVLPEIMQLLLARADRLSFVTDAATGQTEKVMQPTTILALLEQTGGSYSSLFGRVVNSWSNELAKVFRLNRKYMDPHEYFTVLDVDGQLQREGASRMDYEEDLQVIPIADPEAITKREKLAQAEAEWQHLAQNPIVLQSPMHLRNASRRYLEAIGAQNIDEVLPKIEPPMRVDDPAQENMMAIMPGVPMPPVLPDQDHLMHMQSHEAIMSDPAYMHRLSPEAISKLKSHNETHLAFLYGMVGAVQPGVGGPVQGGPMGMGQEAGGPMALSGAPGAVPPGNGVAAGATMGPPEPSQGPTGSPSMGRGPT
jgi:hypothetical protein